MLRHVLFAQGMLLNSDSFPGQDRSKLCMASKVCYMLCRLLPCWQYGHSREDMGHWMLTVTRRWPS